MTTVGAYDAKTQLPQLLERVWEKMREKDRCGRAFGLLGGKRE
jgi:hypothetical protein